MSYPVANLYAFIETEIDAAIGADWYVFDIVEMTADYVRVRVTMNDLTSKRYVSIARK